MPRQDQAPKPRDLYVLTRDHGTRKENPLLTDQNNKYYLPSKVRTSALRKEADDLLKGKTGFGLKINAAKKAPAKVTPKRVSK